MQTLNDPMHAAMSCFYVALNHLPLADGVTLFFLNPALTCVAAWLILKEPLGLNVSGCCVCGE